MSNRLTRDERRLLVALLTSEAWDLCGRFNPDNWPEKDRPALLARLEQVVSARLKLAAALPEKIDSLAHCLESTGARITSKHLLGAMRQSNVKTD